MKKPIGGLKRNGVFSLMYSLKPEDFFFFKE